MTRARAQKAGLVRYSTGKPCKWGHLGERLTSDGHCIACKRLREKKYRQRGGPGNGKMQSYLRDYKFEKKQRAAGRPCPPACEVCGRRTKRRMHFDHDHATGQFRGWLCFHCNAVLGHVGDQPEILRALAKYLDGTWSSP
jgi:hypothetical protein